MQFLSPKIFVILIVFWGLVGCKHRANAKKTKIKIENSLPIVFLQPLGNFNEGLAVMLKVELENDLPIKVILTSAIPLPTSAWYAPRHRYWADSILVVLKTLHNQTGNYTLGITEEDISTKKNLQQNWGVMGLGYQPGYCCVVSTYRLYKYPQSQSQLLEKLVKVSLHELGHNEGLPHCAILNCIMTDAKGKDILSNENGFCKQCTKMLIEKGLKPKKALLL